MRLSLLPYFLCAAIYARAGLVNPGFETGILLDGRLVGIPHHRAWPSTRL
jgi:hypothetical protein